MPEKVNPCNGQKSSKNDSKRSLIASLDWKYPLPPFPKTIHPYLIRLSYDNILIIIIKLINECKSLKCWTNALIGPCFYYYSIFPQKNKLKPVSKIGIFSNILWIFERTRSLWTDLGKCVFLWAWFNINPNLMNINCGLQGVKPEPPEQSLRFV